jgi:hypothetical protein
MAWNLVPTSPPVAPLGVVASGEGEEVRDAVSAELGLDGCGLLRRPPGEGSVAEVAVVAGEGGGAEAGYGVARAPNWAR